MTNTYIYIYIMNTTVNRNSARSRRGPPVPAT